MTRRILFLNPPSYEGFDGGAGSRYQAKREVLSFWYPTWLAQASALCPESRLIDAPVEDMTPEETINASMDFDIVVIYTSTPGFVNDAMLTQSLKQNHPDMMVGMVGPHPSVLPEETLKACPSLDFVARGEFDLTVKDISVGKPLSDIAGLSFNDNGRVVHNRNRELINDMDMLPSVLDVYKRDLKIEKYFIGYLLHPYLSVYTGRGCPGQCTFCLWPQTIGGHKYRTRSVENIIEEMARAKEMFPQVNEYFFDDDTFTAGFKRAEDIAKGMNRLGLTWSCSSRANVPEKTLEVLKDNGVRCIMVGIESGNDDILRRIKKGVTTEQMRRFMKTCRKLKIVTHATFVVGLPGETKKTIRQTIDFAKQIDPDTIQVSIASPYPGTELYNEAISKGWMKKIDLVSNKGVQQASLDYRDLSGSEIFDAVETIYKKFYFRPKPISRIVLSMLKDRDVCRRRLREAREFFGFMKNRKQ